MPRSSATVLAVIAALGCASRLHAQDVTATKSGEFIEFRAGGEPVGRYQFAGVVQVDKGEGTKPLAKPFFYPLFAPGQLPVTRDWPLKRGTPGETTDHFHQKSVWFCHGDVIPDGGVTVRSADKNVKGVDFWAEGGNHGRIVCTAVGEPTRPLANRVEVRTTNEWVAAEGLKLLDEVRTLSVVALPTGRLLVFDIDLTAAVPVTFGDTKEGSMGVRVPDGFRASQKDGGTVTSSAGKSFAAPVKDNLPLWGEVADWNDYSAEVDGKPAGLAVFADPSNPVPSAWHTRAYGLMAANPFGRAGAGFPSQKGKTELVKLAKGDRLKLRFGVYAHAGDVTGGKVAEAYKTFVEMK
jgi:hypothetical protein